MLDRAGLPPGLVALFEWLERQPFAIDLAVLRRRFPEVGWRTFADWAGEREGRLSAAVADAGLAA